MCCSFSDIILQWPDYPDSVVVFMTQNISMTTASNRVANIAADKLNIVIKKQSSL